MKSFNQFLYEMAMPSDKIKGQTYYHGTRSLASATSIAQNGIEPPDIGNRKASLTPVKGKTYATPDIGYAQIYGIGGNVAGSDYDWKKRNEERYGHVFAFSGHKLSDVQPDEDEIGALYYNKKHPHWMENLVQKHSTPNTIRKVKDGEYAAFARMGKNIVSKMTDSQKLELIHNHNVHVANEGKIMPDKVYRIDKEKLPLLKRDGSNFFDHADELDMNDLKKGIHTVI